MSTDLTELPEHAFTKADPADDALFYIPSRLVTHIDQGATAALTRFYVSLLPEHGAVLDLMSSWISHLPEDLELREVVGHGMNGEELAANPRLDRWFVQDLNADPVLPLPSESFDAVLCCVGVQYLQQPVSVFREVKRLLRPGGVVVVSFSNRCFPTKAVAVWQALDGRGHAALVRLYLQRAGFGTVETAVLCDGRDGDPLTAGRRSRIIESSCSVRQRADGRLQANLSSRAQRASRWHDAGKPTLIIANPRCYEACTGQRDKGNDR